MKTDFISYQCAVLLRGYFLIFYVSMFQCFNVSFSYWYLNFAIIIVINNNWIRLSKQCWNSSIGFVAIV